MKVPIRRKHIFGSAYDFFMGDVLQAKNQKTPSEYWGWGLTRVGTSSVSPGRGR